MSKLNLEVLTPEKAAVNREVDGVYLQGSEGRLGILPGHTMLISNLDFGVLEIREGSDREELLCGAGLVEVNEDRVTVLVRSAETREDVNVERAQRARDRAKQRRDAKDDGINLARCELALYRAIERLKFTGQM
jgi:F-type H+-transporting ATPase subunit epsilon